MSSTPAQFMARALRLARLGALTSFPNPRVGCVIVQSGEVVGEGWHARAGEAHAEIHALRAAGERARGSELFVTLEPCAHHGRTPPCVDAVFAARPRKVWVAMRDPNPRVAGRGIETLRASGIEVETGLLEGAARELNRGFLSRMERGRPHVTLKLAASLDGRTAMASGESQWITGEAARADVHRLRAEAGAVLSASGTVLADDPALTVRDVQGVARQPDRIVLDSQARVPHGARVWHADGARRLRVHGVAGAAPIAGVQDLRAPLDANGHVDLTHALRALADHEVNSVLVECGAVLAGALLQARLVDELVVYLAPRLLGDAARGLARLPGLERLADAPELRLADVRRVGADLRLTLNP